MHLGDKPMTRSELTNKLLKENPELALADVENIIETFFSQIVATLEKGGRVELRGFGTFSVKKRDKRTGRNPRTGEYVEVAPKNVPFFKIGRQLHARLNSK